MAPKLRAFLPAFLLSLLLDQGSKLWVVSHLAYRGGRLEERTANALEALGQAPGLPVNKVVIPHVLEFVHAQNPAAAMGLMLGFEYRLYVFAAFTLVAVGVLTMVYRALPTTDRLQAAGLGVLLSGVVGNAIDRAHKGTVTDFIKVIVEWEPLRTWMVKAIGSNEWYTFNIADAAIFVGVGLYLIATLFTKDGDGEVEDTGSRPSLDDGVGSNA